MRYTLKKICAKCGYAAKDAMEEQSFLDLCNYIFNNPGSGKPPRCPECRDTLRIAVNRDTNHREDFHHGNKKN